MTAGDLAPTVFAARVVSEARAKRGRVFRVVALAVDEEMRGQGPGWHRGNKEVGGRVAVGGWAEVWADG